jgi:hypothetical protein
VKYLPTNLKKTKMKKKDIKKLVGIYRQCVDVLKLETRTNHYSNTIKKKINKLCKDYELTQRRVAIV